MYIHLNACFGLRGPKNNPDTQQCLLQLRMGSDGNSQAHKFREKGVQGLCKQQFVRIAS